MPRTLIVTHRVAFLSLVLQAKREGPDEMALPQLAGEAVCAAVQDYADFDSTLPEYRVFGLRFTGSRMLAARFAFSPAYLDGIHQGRELVETVSVPLWGGPPVQQRIGTDGIRWGLDLCEAGQRLQAFQLLTAMAHDVRASAAVARAMKQAAAQGAFSPAPKIS